MGLQHIGTTTIDIAGRTVEVTRATIPDFMAYYQVDLMNPKVLIGVFIGSMMAFLFCGLTMNAVGRAARKMVEEVRRQFREIKGILTGEATPDYARCVAISTQGAQREMLFPSILAIIAPVLVGIIFGVAGVMGLLALEALQSDGAYKRCEFLRLCIVALCNRRHGHWPDSGLPHGAGRRRDSGKQRLAGRQGDGSGWRAGGLRGCGGSRGRTHQVRAAWGRVRGRAGTGHQNAQGAI